MVETVNEKMEELREGRSEVQERGHTVIVGCTDRTLPLIAQLCEANESQGYRLETQYRNPTAKN